MSKQDLSADEQELIIKRARRRCEYCNCWMDFSSQSFEFEHIIPISRGGATTLKNIALACGGCNRHKYTKVSVIDPVSQKMVAIYNPREQSWREHFA